MGKSTEYYLSKGFDPQHAAYFANGRKQIMKVVPEKNFTLLLTFNNCETRRLDMRPLLQAGTVFARFVIGATSVVYIWTKIIVFRGILIQISTAAWFGVIKLIYARTAVILTV